MTVTFSITEVDAWRDDEAIIRGRADDVEVRNRCNPAIMFKSSEGEEKNRSFFCISKSYHEVVSFWIRSKMGRGKKGAATKC